MSRAQITRLAGTSGTAFAVHPHPTHDATGEVAGGYLPLMCTLNAARVLSAGAAGHRPGGPGAGGLTLLSYLEGERTPNLPTATGTLAGMTRANLTPENVARAFVEGMLLNVAAGIDSLRREGVEVERVLPQQGRRDRHRHRGAPRRGAAVRPHRGTGAEVPTYPRTVAPK